MRRILIAACALVLLMVLPGVVIKRGPSTVGGAGGFGVGPTLDDAGLARIAQMDRIYADSVIGAPNIYIAPRSTYATYDINGDDANSGMCPTDPISSLARLEVILAETGRATVHFYNVPNQADGVVPVFQGLDVDGGFNINMTGCLGDDQALCILFRGYQRGQPIHFFGGHADTVASGFATDDSLFQCGLQSWVNVAPTGWCVLENPVITGFDQLLLGADSYTQGMDIFRSSNGPGFMVLGGRSTFSGDADQGWVTHDDNRVGGGTRMVIVNHESHNLDDGVVAKGGQGAVCNPYGICMMINSSLLVSDVSGSHNMIDASGGSNLWLINSNLHQTVPETNDATFVYLSTGDADLSSTKVTVLRSAFWISDTNNSEGYYHFQFRNNAQARTYSVYAALSSFSQMSTFIGARQILTAPIGPLEFRGRCLAIDMTPSAGVGTNGGYIFNSFQSTDAAMFNVMDIRESSFSDQHTTGNVYRFDPGGAPSATTIAAFEAIGNVPADWWTCLDGGNCFLSDALSVDRGADTAVFDDGATDLSLAKIVPNGQTAEFQTCTGVYQSGAGGMPAFPGLPAWFTGTKITSVSIDGRGASMGGR